MIHKRLSVLSYSKDKFDKAKLLYKKSLQEIGHITTISYTQTEVKSNKNRSRNIIWFNPPFSQNVKTNIGKILLKLIKKTVSQIMSVFTIFNQDTILLSYSCMSNISSFIKQHNRNILSSPPNSEERSCNCKNKSNCPLAGSSLKTCIVYRADVIK